MTILLARVRDEAEEVRTLRTDSTTGQIVPVLLNDDHFQRLCALLTRHGQTYEVLSPTSHIQSKTQAARPAAHGLRKVVEIGRVPSPIILMARHLFINRCSRNDERKMALVLLKPTELRVKDALHRLVSLRKEGYALGVIPCFDPQITRFTLLKSLLIDRVVVAPAHTLFFVPGAAPGSPPAIVEDDPPFPMHQAQLLSLSGHSNNFDMSVGNHVVCGRGPIERGGRHRFPCYADDYCHVLNEKRAKADSGRLADPKNFRAALVILRGCNLFVPGRGPSAPGTGILGRLLDGDCIASLVSMGLSRPIIELDLLWLSLLQEGLSLGEAWRVLESYEREQFSGRHERESMTSLLIGNPAMELNGIPVVNPDEKAEWAAGIDPHFGALLRLPLDAQPRLRASLEAEGLWYCGIQTKEHLLCWVHKPTSAEVKLGRSADPELSTRVLNAFQAFHGELSFWEVYIRSWSEAAKKQGSDSLDAEECSAGIALLRFRGAKLLVGLENRSVQLFARAPSDDLLSLLADEIQNSSRSLLQKVINHVLRFGLLQFHVSNSSYVHTSVQESVELCACGESDRDAWIWKSKMGAPDRWVYECLRCGPVGEDGGKPWVRVVSRSAPTEIGSVMSMEFELRAPDHADLFVFAQAVIENWRRELSRASDLVEERVEAGVRRLFRLEVQIPAEVTPGLHTVGLVAIANGTLFIDRHVIEFI